MRDLGLVRVIINVVIMIICVIVSVPAAKHETITMPLMKCKPLPWPLPPGNQCTLAVGIQRPQIVLHYFPVQLLSLQSIDKGLSKS